MSEPFPPDRGLEARMLVAVLLQAAIVVAYAAALVYVIAEWEAGWGWAFFALCFLLIGLGAPALAAKGHDGTDRDRERVEALTGRLAQVAGIAPPHVLIHDRAAPLSWTTAVPFGKRKLHVTTGLLRRLREPELEAVVAHELGHLINRDALVMTTLIGPPVALLRGLRNAWNDPKDKWRARLAVLMFGWVVAPFALVGTLTGRIVSRHRELAADRAAAVLTGSPARVQAALLAVGDGLAQIPTRDLRAVAARDPFHFVPARPAKGIARLWATHPPIDARVQRLARLEADLQGKSAFTQG